MKIYLTWKEQEFLYNVLDKLTKNEHYCKISEEEAEQIAKPLFKEYKKGIFRNCIWENEKDAKTV